MKPLFLSDEVKLYEAEYFHKGNSDKQLMLKAAKVATNFIAKNTSYKKFICVCGPGNNGGDGYYIGINLSKMGFDVKIIDAIKNKEKSLLCKNAFNIAFNANLIHEQSVLDNNQKNVAIIDAIFGTSLKGSVSPSISMLINKMNNFDEIFSIDLPSGIDPDLGISCGTHVNAKKTISFVGRKVGLSLNEGKISSGKLYFDNLDLDMQTQSKALAISYNFEDVKDLTPRRLNDSHKGNHGKTVIFGGDIKMGGAAIMAAEMSLKSGSGLVSLITQPLHVKASLIRNPEIMTIGCERPNGFKLDPDNNTFVCGPGLTDSNWSKGIIELLINYSAKINGSIILDAGALRYLAKNNNCLENNDSPIILTPHPGEAADLLNTSIKEVQQDRVNSAKKLVEIYSATVALKGYGTIIANKEELYICEEGGPELATGGTGDILVGLIGGLISQGLSSLNACLLAVAAHGKAGSQFKLENGMNGLAASELIPYIRKTLNKKDD